MTTAWFLTDRIREAMANRDLGDIGSLGGNGEIVEIDETFIGMPLKALKCAPWLRSQKRRSLACRARRRGAIVPCRLERKERRFVSGSSGLISIAKETHVMSDEVKQYEALVNEFAEHDAVDHGRKEYAYTDRKTGVVVTTNSDECYYSVFKRGMKGVYQHCTKSVFTATRRNSISAIQTGHAFEVDDKRCARTSRCAASLARG